MLNVSGKKRNYKPDSLFAMLIMVPVMAYFILFFYYPFVTNFIYMFTDYDFLSKMKFAGLDNIVRFFRDRSAGAAFKTTFIITFASVPITVIASLIISTMLFYVQKGKSFFRGAIFSTYLTSIVVAAIIFKQWFGVELGFINGVLQSIGLTKVPWLTDTRWAMVTLITMTVWKNIGYYTIIYLAGLSNIDGQLYEACTIDGANTMQKFLYVTIPELTPVTSYILIISTISYLKIYPQAVVLTGGGPYESTKPVLMYMFEQAFRNRNIGYAATISIALFLVISVFTVIQFKLTKSDK